MTNQSFNYQPVFVERVKGIVIQELRAIPKDNGNVVLDEYVVMPTHIHAILCFIEAEYPLSEVWRRFKAELRRGWGELNYIKPIWQRNFFERVIRSDYALSNIRSYINNNPCQADCLGINWNPSLVQLKPHKWGRYS